VRPVMLTDRTQRWRDRRSLFVSDHHYLPRYPAAQVAVGLFGPGAAGRPALAGLIVFGVPATGAVITRHTGFTDPAQGCVLQRLLCLPSVAANGESFFASRAFRLLRFMRPRIEAVVSFSDPAFGHCGGVYAALSGAYRGRTRPRQVLRIAGETISDRTLSKIRNLESGHAGAIDQLVRLGAPRPRPMEHPRAWLDRCREAHILTSARQSPLFTYCFELTRNARRTGGALPRMAYPVRSDVLREQLEACAAPLSDGSVPLDCSHLILDIAGHS
jgi:hypothetical protein